MAMYVRVCMRVSFQAWVTALSTPKDAANTRFIMI